MKKENSILFLGDVVPYKPLKFKNNYKTIFNLECPITKEGNPVVGKINLRVRENYLKEIFNDNILCVSLGNNHILDYGKEGLDSTLEQLQNLNVAYFGISNICEVEYTPLIVNLNNSSIAFFSVVCQSTSPIIIFDNKTYINLLDLDKMVASILEVRKSVQKIVIYIHWGVEESSYPSKDDVLMARKFIDAGADIIIGSHAHAPQSIEKYKNGIIAYNLGNFLMPGMNNMPSYFNKNGVPLSTFSKSLMLWNRISWGLIIDIENMEYKIKKYIYLFNRIIELPFTPLDRYISLNENVLNSSYENILENHLRKRSFYRKVRNFVYKPHIPKKLKQLL